MPNFAANLSTMFNEVSFMDRFSAAARNGFRAVEFLFPYEYSPQAIAAKLSDNGLKLALFNLHPGNHAAGERGIACLPGREQEFAASVDKAIAYAKVLGNTHVHAMAGIVPEGADRAELERVYLANMKNAAAHCAQHGLTICLEPINQRSMPGYFLARQDQAARYIDALGASNVVLQFDFFHVQMEEGCVSYKFREFFPIIGHCQIAGVPDRHEPDTGEICYSHVFDLMDSLGYSGYVGCEYIPAADTENGLGWFSAWKHTQK
jgi:2-dehydrotetronate isomerase